jgi:hypothetical protein
MADRCPNCDEPVESGPLIPHFVEVGMIEPRRWHWECWQRQVIGGVNHQRHACTCCGGTEPPDPPGMTRREAARAAVALYYGARNA